MMKNNIKSTIVFMIILMIVSSFGACGRQSENKASILGRWEYINSFGTIEYYDFSSNTVAIKNSNQGGTADYSIDDDGTLHLSYGSWAASYKRISVEEMEKLSESEAGNYYAFNNEVLYFRDKREFKRK